MDKTPAITIEFDFLEQKATVSFDRDQIKNWSMLKAVLEMAKEKVDDQRRLQMMQTMQRQHDEALGAQKLAEQLANRNLKLG